MVASNFGQNNGPLMKLALTVGHLFMIAPDAGAKTTIYVATAPELEGVSGKYFDKCKEKQPRASAQNDDDAAALWALSERLTATTTETSAAT